MELLAVAHLAQDVKEELMEERDSAAVDAAQTVEAYWDITDIVKRMPESEVRRQLVAVLEAAFGTMMIGAPDA